MGVITFPPSSQTTETIQECYSWGEPMNVQFTESGYFSGDNSEAFTPNPPTGNFVAPVTIGPYNAVAQNSSVTFTFFDTVTGKSYSYEITIQQEKCP